MTPGVGLRRFAGVWLVFSLGCGGHASAPSAGAGSSGSTASGAGGQPNPSGGGGAFASTAGFPTATGGQLVAGGQGGVPPIEREPSPNYDVTGSWPEQLVALATQPGVLTYTKVRLHDRFLAESCSIADYNNDGEPDVSSGRRWYEGPFGPGVPTVEHVFRGGHDDLPRDGLSPEIVTGVSDSWASYPFDMDGDGWVDIINIANPDADETKTPSPNPMPQAHATAYWYKNPGTEGGEGMWQGYLLHNDVRGEQHGLVDVDGDGLPEIFGACKGCEERKGYYFGDWREPTKKWQFHPVTLPVEFPYSGTGWLSGFGFGRINDDTTPDFLERNGIWLDPLSPEPGSSHIPTPLFIGPTESEAYGPSHLQAFDVDGDGDGDIVGADNSKNYGLSWYEQTEPQVFVRHSFLNSSDQGAFSSPSSLQVADMDGDGVPEVITGKMRFPLPEGCGIPDLQGDPVSYVFKIRRNTPDAVHGGSVTFEAHPIDTDPVGMEAGVGRQIAVGHANTDGIMDVCVATKLGLYVYLGG